MNKKKLHKIIKKIVEVEEYSLDHLNIIASFLKDLGEDTINWDFNLLELSEFIYRIKDELYL